MLEAILTGFLDKYGALALALVVLIAADVILGIASAVKRGVFQWDVVANFYRTNVVPKLVGWLGLQLVVYAVSLPGVIDVIGVPTWVDPAVATASLVAVGASLLNSIYDNARELFNIPALPPSA